MKHNIKVLFLILNYKTYKETLRLTRELAEEGLDDKFILIVDNASPNESFVELSSQLSGITNVEVIESPENGGFAKGNNFGLRYAQRFSPKFVCVINNDIHFKMSTIDNLCDWYEKLPCPGVIAPLQMLPNGCVATFPTLAVPDILSDISLYNPLSFKQHKYESNTQFENVQRVGLIPGAFSFIEYDKFRRLGFFDEDTFLFCEERFLAFKIRQAALKNYIILDNTYLHDHSVTISSEASKKRQRQMMLEGREKYYRKYSRHPRLTIAILKLAYHVGECAINIKKKLKP